ncbi:hypothetical protein [Dongshaea marina]|uniref:hypothetical protein n=1 Tax=Dongshaea marina TaxID=2047966 RepID=UPI000D3E192C|nr:hypothetical protein [Dongshaea marina]
MYARAGDKSRLTLSQNDAGMDVAVRAGAHALSRTQWLAVAGDDAEPDTGLSTLTGRSGGIETATTDWQAHLHNFSAPDPHAMPPVTTRVRSASTSRRYGLNPNNPSFSPPVAGALLMKVK